MRGCASDHAGRCCMRSRRCLRRCGDCAHRASRGCRAASVRTRGGEWLDGGGEGITGRPTMSEWPERCSPRTLSTFHNTSTIERTRIRACVPVSEGRSERGVAGEIVVVRSGRRWATSFAMRMEDALSAQWRVLHAFEQERDE